MQPKSSREFGIAAFEWEKMKQIGENKDQKHPLDTQTQTHTPLKLMWKQS
jgi:hypothetical protein